MTAVEQLAHFAVSAPYDELSETAREQLKIRILDALGCGIGALESTPTQIIRKNIDEFDVDLWWHFLRRQWRFFGARVLALFSVGQRYWCA